MNTTIKLILVCIIFFLGGFLIFVSLNYLQNGYLTFFEEEFFCVDLFFEEYGELPLYYGQNGFGECIYKFSDLEQSYTPFSELLKRTKT